MAHRHCAIPGSKRSVQDQLPKGRAGLPLTPVVPVWYSLFKLRSRFKQARSLQKHPKNTKPMKLSTRGRYGARALMELAKHYGEGPVALKEMASKQDIPIKYLEQIAIVLRDVRLIRSVRGPFGGYVLSRAPDKVNLLEIVESLEGPLSFVNCVRDPSSCKKTQSCVFNDLWKTVSRETSKVLRSVTLADMVRMESEKKSSLLECLEEGVLSGPVPAGSSQKSFQGETTGQSLSSRRKGSKSRRTFHR